MKLAFLFFIFIFGHQAYAASVEIAICMQTPQNAPIGTTCITSAGIHFLRQDGAWHDLGPNGKIWHDGQGKKTCLTEAEIFCADNKLRLPTGYSKNTNGYYGFPNSDSEFTTAMDHKIAEVYKDMSVTDANFWTSSKFNDRNNIHYIFYYWVLWEGQGGHLSHVPGYNDGEGCSRVPRCIGDN